VVQINLRLARKGSKPFGEIYAPEEKQKSRGKVPGRNSKITEGIVETKERNTSHWTLGEKAQGRLAKKLRLKTD